ncbi:phosphatidate cytidylyltransferase [Saccharibacillus sp. CPCC 101409]|uniref:phosphatidate cytidylyltransferase n=1 Tax=Saccharibacillus sp. CPCC 101409 TaxID=3058041 RepID=UPI0026712AC8|nr:phosphatidate cytidylyltransferase [Saccharibacillus sp. CPCC 101409]MDO3410665.1 phosphatidate cytidylyltransferase [Saccharibacillus sp. CPCC 101409]
MKQRIITGVVAGVLFLGLCVLGGFGYPTLIMLMALVGYYEFAKMGTGAPFRAEAWIGYAGVAYLTFPWQTFGLHFPMPPQSVFWLLLLLLLCATVLSKNEINIKQTSLLFLGIVYVGFGFYYIAASRETPDGHGLFWTFLLLLSIWGSDAGAYFTGKAFGRRKLWPAISPNKTIEGAVGGLLIAVVIALGFSLADPELLHPMRAIVLGLAASIVGQMGDLIQSAYKRVYGIKDSGSILPGHGGILDRCDSWLAVFPIVHILFLLPY